MSTLWKRFQNQHNNNEAQEERRQLRRQYKCCQSDRSKSNPITRLRSAKLNSAERGVFAKLS